MVDTSLSKAYLEVVWQLLFPSVCLTRGLGSPALAKAPLVMWEGLNPRGSIIQCTLHFPLSRACLLGVSCTS